MDYQLYNSEFSRKGTVLFNVTPTGYSSISDNFTFTDSLTPYFNVDALSATTGTTLVINTASNAGIQQVIDSPGNWYITPVLNPSVAAYIENAYQDENTYVIEIGRFNPEFTFEYPSSYTISKTNNPDSNFSYQDQSGKNYVSLTFKPSTSTQYRLEYQIDIQI